MLQDRGTGMSDADVWVKIPNEIFNEGRVDLIDEYFSPDFVEHVPTPPGLPAGREGLRMFVTALLGAFPDFRYEIVGQYRDGDTHILHVRGSGTMTGDFMGMPAANKKATWEEIHIGRMRGGQVVEHWAVVDQLSMLQELGFAPLPPTP
jgi:predicted ester cyclase